MRLEKFIEHQAGAVAGWNRVALQAIRALQPGHLAAARALAILHTCMYNAWAAYDGKARQTVHGVAVRLPHHERGAASKAAAMSHAAWLALAGQFPSRQAMFDAQLASLGLALPPADASPFTPAAIGRAQAASMLDVCQKNRQALPFALAGLRQDGFDLQEALAGCRAGSHGGGLLPGHWAMLARHLSERGGYGDDEDVLLYFALANAMSDAAIAASGAVRADCKAAAGEVLGRFGGVEVPPGPAATAGEELGRRIGALAFDKARRYWEGRL